MSNRQAKSGAVWRWLQELIGVDTHVPTRHG